MKNAKKATLVFGALCLCLAVMPGAAAQRPDNMYKIHVNVVERAMKVEAESPKVCVLGC